MAADIIDFKSRTKDADDSCVVIKGPNDRAPAKSAIDAFLQEMKKRGGMTGRTRLCLQCPYWPIKCGCDLTPQKKCWWEERQAR
jgi:hypothetical protein